MIVSLKIKELIMRVCYLSAQTNTQHAHRYEFKFKVNKWHWIVSASHPANTQIMRRSEVGGSKVWWVPSTATKSKLKIQYLFKCATHWWSSIPLINVHSESAHMLRVCMVFLRKLNEMGSTSVRQDI
jgi:hypothetical protein